MNNFPFFRITFLVSLDSSHIILLLYNVYTWRGAYKMICRCTFGARLPSVNARVPSIRPRLGSRDYPNTTNVIIFSTTMHDFINRVPFINSNAYRTLSNIQIAYYYQYYYNLWYWLSNAHIQLIINWIANSWY